MLWQQPAGSEWRNNLLRLLFSFYDASPVPLASKGELSYCYARQAIKLLIVKSSLKPGVPLTLTLSLALKYCKYSMQQQKRHQNTKKVIGEALWSEANLTLVSEKPRCPAIIGSVEIVM